MGDAFGSALAFDQLSDGPAQYVEDLGGDAAGEGDRAGHREADRLGGLRARGDGAGEALGDRLGYGSGGRGARGEPLADPLG